MSDNELQNPWEPKSVRNMDVVGAVERFDRFAFDMAKFESAVLNEITQFDLARIQQYNTAMRTYVDTLNTAPLMDLPFSYPSMYTIVYLTENFEFDSVKNKALRDILRMYVNGWVQLSRSESADKSNGFLSYDVHRFHLIMDRIDFYIASYINQALPLDLPESSQYIDANG